MILDDARILRLFELVVKCLEGIDQGTPDMMKARLAELKEELRQTITDVTPW